MGQDMQGYAEAEQAYKDRQELAKLRALVKDLASLAQRPRHSLLVGQDEMIDVFDSHGVSL